MRKSELIRREGQPGFEKKTQGDRFEFDSK